MRYPVRSLLAPPPILATDRSEPPRPSWEWTPTSTGAIAAVGAVAVILATGLGGAAAPTIILRIALIGAFAAAAIIAQRARDGSQLGQLLGTVTSFCVLWMLGGASWGPARAVGVVLCAAAPAVLAYLMLVYPSGWLRTAPEQLLLVIGIGALIAGALTIMTSTSLIVIIWLVLAAGTVALMLGRGRLGPPGPTRCALVPYASSRSRQHCWPCSLSCGRLVRAPGP